MHINCAFFVLRSLLIVAGFLKHIESIYVIIIIERVIRKINRKVGFTLQESFGETVLELSKEDMRHNPKEPVVRMYDDDELIGKFSLKTLEVIENIDMADYDIRFAQKEIKRNQSNWLETWRDYVGILNA